MARSKRPTPSVSQKQGVHRDAGSRRHSKFRKGSSQDTLDLCEACHPELRNFARRAGRLLAEVTAKVEGQCRDKGSGFAKVAEVTQATAELLRAEEARANRLATLRRSMDELNRHLRARPHPSASIGASQTLASSRVQALQPTACITGQGANPVRHDRTVQVACPLTASQASLPPVATKVTPPWAVGRHTKRPRLLD